MPDPEPPPLIFRRLRGFSLTSGGLRQLRLAAAAALSALSGARAPHAGGPEADCRPFSGSSELEGVVLCWGGGGGARKVPRALFGPEIAFIACCARLRPVSPHFPSVQGFFLTSGRLRQLQLAAVRRLLPRSPHEGRGRPRFTLSEGIKARLRNKGASGSWSTTQDNFAWQHFTTKQVSAVALGVFSSGPSFAQLGRAQCPFSGLFQFN